MFPKYLEIKKIKIKNNCVTFYYVFPSATKLRFYKYMMCIFYKHHIEILRRFVRRRSKITILSSVDAFKIL